MNIHSKGPSGATFDLTGLTDTGRYDLVGACEGRFILEANLSREQIKELAVMLATVVEHEEW